MNNIEYYKWFLYFAGATIGSLPAICIRGYINNNNFLFIVGALVAYMILIYIYYKIFLCGAMDIVYTVMNIFMILFVIFAGVFIFGESLNKYNIIGIILAIISIALLNQK